MNVGAAFRSSLPGPVKEVARLTAARRLERRLRASGAVRGAALVLHAVAPEAGDPDVEVDPPLSVRGLDSMVGYLKRRYALVRAVDLLPAAHGRSPGEPVPVALTFDDDLVSHLEFAAPVVAEHRGVATVFLCGTREPFWWHALQSAIDEGNVRATDLPEVPEHLVANALARRPRAIARVAKAIEDLDPERREQAAASLVRIAPSALEPLDGSQAEALAAQGWEIGFHTRRHDMLLNLDDDRLAEALTAGRDALSGGPPRTLAYPHGKAGAREARAAGRSGYAAAFTGRAEVVTEVTEPHLIGRLQPDVRTPGRFALQLARALADV
jgi:peptidoglycan/xylan/chitin deacetylase (PgdA/CDA1 family)